LCVKIERKQQDRSHLLNCDLKLDVLILVRPSMTETTALGAAVAAGAAEGIALWDIKSKNESSDVTIFQPKLDTSGKSVVLFYCTRVALFT
jgi:glycerol kinase